MNIRFYNARILSMIEGEEIYKGELHVEGNRISYMGEEEKPEGTWEREIDCKGNILMPGFKNAHTHSAMTFLRSYADDLPLQEWLYNRVFPMEAKLTGEYVYELSRLAVMEYLSSGMTANFDMYMQNPSNAQASIDTGFRTVLCGSINDFGGTVEEMEQEYLHFNDLHDRISYQLGFHAEYTTKPEILNGMAALGQKYKKPVYCHNSETKNEVEGCVERYGMTPTTYLDSLGMFEYGGGGFHCVHMTEQDLAICRDKGIHVVTNPASNAKLASGIAPIVTMQDMGISLSIGTDGPASNNCLDMFREMFLVTGLQKLAREDAAAMDGADVLRMATVGGAKAMGLDEADVLAEGKLADIVMLDMHQPNMQPENNIVKNIVYSGSKQNVKMTMVDGNILYEDGKYSIGVEPEEVYAKANEIIQKMNEA